MNVGHALRGVPGGRRSQGMAWSPCPTIGAGPYLELLALVLGGVAAVEEAVVDLHPIIDLLVCAQRP